MSRKTYLLLAALLVAALYGFGAGCSAGTDDLDGGSSSNGANGLGGNGADNQGGTGAGFDTGGGPPDGQQIVIEPANFELLVVDGTIPTQALTATLQGSDVTDQVAWSFEKPFIGDVITSAFTPTGNAGGTGTINATLGDASGSAIATVKIKKTLNTGGLPQMQIDQLDNPQGGPDPSMSVVYPYDQTVFPLNVLAPEIMWNGTQPADVYKLTIVEANYDYTEYFAAPPPSRKLITETDWANISISGGGAQSDPVAVSITRLSGGVAYQPAVRTWRIAQGRLKGVIYYWELPNTGGNGRILRIRPDSAVAEQFYTPPSNGCWGCHTVSRDGTKMMANLDQPFPFPQISIDLTQEPAVSGTITQGTGLTGTFSAYNDKGDRILVSDDASSTGIDRLRIVDGNTGAVLNGDPFASQNCAEPAWSPDGTKLAAICGTQGSGWAFDSSIGSLSLADVAADGTTVSNIRTIVPQASGPGRPAYPSFTPGSEFIAFGRPTAGSRSTGQGKIYLSDLAGASVKELTTMSSDNQSFNPVFAPLRAGGYYWVVFITRRAYGNRLGGGNQQLWISAITDPPSAADPSNPPFYVRGQEDQQKSENAYFALEPCKENGEGCESGVDCCSGTCIRDEDTNTYVCGIPGECAQDGNACETASDCCNAPLAECLDGFCQTPPPQ